jgi:hypothetical protein
MENFPFIEEFYSQGAAVRATRETLYDELKPLLLSLDKRRAIGEAAARLLERNRGAVEKAIAVVEGHLKV